MFRIATPGKLKRAGISGMNRRNVEYIAQNNPRHHFPRVDDKLITKQLALSGGIAVPTLLGVVKYTGQIKRLPEFLEPLEQFVIKPSKGSSGRGILVIVGRDGERFVKSSGKTMTFHDISRHINNILSGLFSLGGRPDVAMIEEMVRFSAVFENFTYEGVPDIRVIVYKGYPVMAMTRLSTRASDGKANLHQGAIGVGLDISTGRALHAVQNARPVEYHPDTGARLKDIVVPRWDELIRLAASCHEVTELGYLGADIVLDKKRGPLIIELNARPGLAIQVANGTGLKPRIEKIEHEIRGQLRRFSSDERAAWSLQAFNYGGREEDTR
jgi:alpha-L-glutamate ligase-like protein